MDSAPDLGSGGHKFKSYHSEKYLKLLINFL